MTNSTIESDDLKKIYEDYKNYSKEFYSKSQNILFDSVKNLISLSTFIFIFILTGFQFVSDKQLPISVQIVITISWVSLFASIIIGLVIYFMANSWLNSLGEYWGDWSEAVYKLSARRTDIDSSKLDKKPPEFNIVTLLVIIQTTLFVIGFILSMTVGLFYIWSN